MNWNRFTTLLLFVFISISGFSQKVIFEKEPQSFGDKKFGQNRSWFMHPFISIDYQYPTDSYNDFSSQYESTFGFGFGLRIKKRIVPRVALSADLKFDWLNYSLEPTNNYEGKFAPISDQKWLNKIQYRSFNFMPMLGARYNFYRGNSIGPYIEAGGFALTALSEKRNLIGGDSYDSKDKDQQKEYSSEVVNPFGVYFRLGANNHDITISYLPQPSYDSEIGITQPKVMFTWTSSLF